MNELSVLAIESRCMGVVNERGGHVVMVVEGVSTDGDPVEVAIAIPARGVQGMRRNLRAALEDIPIEERGN